ncbi:hypothetical protein CFC21_097633 [Triticum aestivum]|uniref:protein-serine/threonine phosphatase n=2 Tax=Triticum aestivum TaxID=4565 RepID=A0A9R1MZV5_WHEAT|nr:hypothetical protein CFC21_004955 [Triticum aestivum]KAF7095474.1 hypothetical protein CFC21_097633 [Triticum aestivum]
MLRAFGDYCIKDYDVISAPEVTQRRITARDQFVILATDGKCSIPPQFELVRPFPLMLLFMSSPQCLASPATSSSLFEKTRGEKVLHADGVYKLGTGMDFNVRFCEEALQDSIRKWTRGRLHPHRRMGDADIGQRQSVQSLRF